MTFHKFIQYLIYRFKAKNRHGIHSPFVYQLLDKCLLVDTHLPVMERLEAYFGKENLVHSSNTGAITDTNILITADIHANANATMNWDKFRLDKDILLSIDLFDIGLLINRPDFKEKQHFVLRTK